ncbi:MAG: DNA-binding response regulator, partial [Caldilineae bacterium]
MPGTTRVFIFSDSVLHAAAWQALLHDQPQLTVVGRAHEPAGVPLLSSGSAILVDVRHPGPDLVAALRKSSPQAGLLFLLPAYDLSQILPLLRAGATGCIAHDAEVSDLARALIAVGRGELALPPAVAVQALAALARG